MDHRYDDVRLDGHMRRRPRAEYGGFRDAGKLRGRQRRVQLGC